MVLSFSTFKKAVEHFLPRQAPLLQLMEIVHLFIPLVKYVFQSGDCTILGCTRAHRCGGLSAIVVQEGLGKWSEDPTSLGCELTRGKIQQPGHSYRLLKQRAFYYKTIQHLGSNHSDLHKPLLLRQYCPDQTSQICDVPFSRNLVRQKRKVDLKQRINAGFPWCGSDCKVLGFWVAVKLVSLAVQVFMSLNQEKW